MSFTKASEFTITGGEFNNVGGDQVKIFNNSVVSNSYQSLMDAISGVGASHNSQQRFPPPRCHPKTRGAVIDVLLHWLDTESCDQPICWLSGPAGVGKSAIAQTIAETLERKGLVASFFFFRQDPKRNNPNYLMLTIAHGLMVNIPELRKPISQRVSADPKILDACLKDQLTDLIFEPLLAQRGWWNRISRVWADWPRPSTRRPNLVIIDGLDECADEKTQTHILITLASELGKHSDSPSPLRFLICSRPEPWIRETFDSGHLRRLRKNVKLDDSFSPDADIACFLRDGFQELSTSPKYAQVQFPVPWPSNDDIQVLVNKARGQFIYAATVLKLVGDGYCHPLERLRLVLKSSQNPSPTSLYQELDGLYQVILSANSDCEGLLSVLASVFLIRLTRELVPIVPTPQLIEMLLGLPDGQVALTLRPLHSVLRIGGRDDEIDAFHTSFTDFLYDQSRSGIYFLDRRRWHDFLVHRWLQVLVAECKLQQLLGSGDKILYGYNSTGIAALWLYWPHFCALSKPISSAVVSNLQNLDLDVLLTAAISSTLLFMQKKHALKWELVRAPPLLHTLWNNLEDIILWLRRRDTPDVQLSSLIQHFEGAREGFQVTVLPDIVQSFAVWTVSNIADCYDLDLTEHVSSKMIHYMEKTSSLPEVYYRLCPTSTSVQVESLGMPLKCSQVPVGHYHISIRAASILMLKTLNDTLDNHLVSLGMSRNLVGAVLGMLHLCGPDPQTISLCHQVLSSFRKQWTQLLGYNYRWSRSPSDIEDIIAWLESFPAQYADKVRELSEVLIELEVITKAECTGGKKFWREFHLEVTREFMEEDERDAWTRIASGSKED